MSDYDKPEDDAPSAGGAGAGGDNGDHDDLPDWVGSTPEGQPGGRHYHYVKNEVLVVEEDERLIVGKMSGRSMRRGDVFRPENSEGVGIVRYLLTTDEGLPQEYRDVLATVTELRMPVPDPDEPETGPDEPAHTYIPRVYPNIAVGLSYHGRPHGAFARHKAGELASPPRRRLLPLPGHGVTIGVIDTGMWKGRMDWFNGRVHLRPNNQDDEVLGDGAGGLTASDGHGRFIAGEIHAIAPGTTVKVRKFGEDEWIADWDLADQIAALAEEGVDIINLSLGGPTHDNTGMIRTEQVIADLRQTKPGMVFVASAGNAGVSVPEYPAAFKGVIGVGALDANKGQAGFSNFGPWVDACALGEDAHSTFVDWPSPSFEGYAKWSGTSFSAPAVAAAIAVRRSPGGWRQLLWFLRPRNARQAADRVLSDPGADRRLNLGTVVKTVSYARPLP